MKAIEEASDTMTWPDSQRPKSWYYHFWSRRIGFQCKNLGRSEHHIVVSSLMTRSWASLLCWWFRFPLYVWSMPLSHWFSIFFSPGVLHLTFLLSSIDCIYLCFFSVWLDLHFSFSNYCLTFHSCWKLVTTLIRRWEVRKNEWMISSFWVGQNSISRSKRQCWGKFLYPGCLLPSTDMSPLLRVF